MAGCYGFLIRAIHLSARARFHWRFLWPCSRRAAIFHTPSFTRSLRTHSSPRPNMSTHTRPRRLHSHCLSNMLHLHLTTPEQIIPSPPLTSTKQPKTGRGDPTRELILQQCKTVTEIRVRQCRRWRGWE